MARAAGAWASWCRSALVVGALAAFAALPACTATVTPTPTGVIVPTESTGTVIIDWTIRAGTDPGDCTLAGVASIRIHIVTIDVVDAGTYEQQCGAFNTSIALAPGTYQASALLVDFAGQARTTSVPIQPFTIVGGDVLTIPIDFPADSFF
jgi:hypothetical protein